ncbi:hypothetical protein ANCCEY_09544 [Ancylostoma ceylanicum]|uniref:Unspecific monooxygenase n=1 Tax=Ancylostoma ceylanicum TaxID=53326 RepID=A0A0D6LHB1_9BILA|nr:hypothetical protein ANCCEY_09544 [Ancylostoma ceylanicum]
MKVILQNRQVKPQYYPEFLFNLIGDGREQAKCVKVLHDFTSSVIRARKEKADAAGGVDKLLALESAEGRRRMAFLDLMLDMNAKGELSMDGVQEEVDTFTFEVLGESDRPVTYEDIGNLKYLEACIKETLRLYPSVPLIARQVAEDIKIKDHILPAGTGVVLIPSMVHRDPNYWDDPEVFRPERFIESELKHPYAYIPFSAGSRNCIGKHAEILFSERGVAQPSCYATIMARDYQVSQEAVDELNEKIYFLSVMKCASGQRFAIMEEKCILALLMRQLRVRALLRTDQMRVAAELIIRPLYGNRMKFEKRSYGDYSHCSA